MRWSQSDCQAVMRQCMHESLAARCLAKVRFTGSQGPSVHNQFAQQMCVAKGNRAFRVLLRLQAKGCDVELHLPRQVNTWNCSISLCLSLSF